MASVNWYSLPTPKLSDSKIGNILDLAVNLDIVNKSGSWFSYKGEKIAQGRDNTKKYLEEHKEIADEIEKKVRENFNKAFENSLTNETEQDDADEEFKEHEE